VRLMDPSIQKNVMVEGALMIAKIVT
jgi:hypothetical protein